MSKGSTRSLRFWALMTAILVLPLQADLKFVGGSIKNLQGVDTHLRYDTDGDGIADIIMADNGYLGIGTLSPMGNLHLVGNIFITNNGEAADYVLASDASGKGTWTDISTLTVSSPWTRSSAGNAYLTAGGNVGIGTTSPVGNLQVAGNILIGSGSALSPALGFAGDSDTGIYWPASNKIAIATGGSLRLLVDDLGKVGIGTASPGSMMEINRGVGANGSAVLTIKTDTDNSDESAQPNIVLSQDGGMVTGQIGFFDSTDHLRIKTTHTNSDIRFNVSGQTDSVIIQKISGYLGVGTSNPTYNIHVSEDQDGGNVGLAIQNYAAPGSTDETTSLDFLTREDLRYTARIVSGREGDYGSVADSDGYMALVPYANNTPVEAIRLSSSGRVGIGTISPAGNLHVVGNALFAGNILPSGNNTYDLGRIDAAFRHIYTTDLTILSDRRLKCDIRPLKSGLERVMGLEAVSYRMKSGDDRERLGFIAQDVFKVVEQVVTVGADSGHTLGIQYTGLIPVLVKAVQEQQHLIDEQGRQILDLKNRLNMTQQQPFDGPPSRRESRRETL
ncbi:MAG: tail fiber domain-containing protein [Planctomycetes bacterium]|nr:tail fiber domain-containing protein [Planctomycetota bacterium]